MNVQFVKLREKGHKESWSSLKREIKGGFQVFYKGIGKNILSIIHRDMFYWIDEMKMIIPKIIGVVSKGFLRHFRSDKILRNKNRLRASEIEEL